MPKHITTNDIDCDQMRARMAALEAAHQYQHEAIPNVTTPTLLNLTWAVEITNKVNKILAALRTFGLVSSS